MTENLVKQFVDSHHYDVRESGNGRWIDQKCTPDEISFIAECVLNYTTLTKKKIFTSPDVWHSDYAMRHVQDFTANQTLQRGRLLMSTISSLGSQ